jgi:hypothetical protein
MVGTCPNCGEVLERGYVKVGGRIEWFSTEHIGRITGEKLVSAPVLFRVKRVAFRCKRCELVMLYYKDVEYESDW